MERNEVMGMTTAAAITILMMGLTRLSVYEEVKDNWLFLFFMIIVMVFLGYGLAKLFEKGKK